MQIRALTIPEIVERCGGPAAIAAGSQSKLSIWAVYKWPKIGIREEWWELVMRLGDVSVEEIYAANQQVRRAAPLQAAE